MNATATPADASTPPLPGARSAKSRRGYIDWMRGLAVLVMIMAHVLDAWTRTQDKATPAYWYLMVGAGMGAPMFLFLAGVAVALAGNAQLRRGASMTTASRALQRRGWQILALAFLFRLQAYLLSPGASLSGLLKVDILNVMGLALVGAAWLWGRAGSRRIAWAIGVTALIGLTTPFVRATPLLTPLPGPVEWYLRPYPGRTNFTLFPWAGFVFAGLAVGEWIARAPTPGAEARLQGRLAVGGALLVGGALAASHLPSVFPNSQFWTSSPTFFLIRVGVLVLLLTLCYAYGRRPTAHRWSPMQQLGRTSLFVYWIHVEMVYGVLSRPLHRQLPLWQSAIAFALFTLLLLGLSLAKTWVAAWWSNRRRLMAAAATG